MKHIFENAGFAQVQADTISLEATALQAKVQEIRNNFVQWLDSTFELGTTQLAQLNRLDATFLQDIADAVADSWAERRTILFNKEQPPTTKSGKEESVKEILLARGKNQTQSFESDTLHTQETVAIQIGYY